ncbi:MAG: DUF2911 domain-containing protein [Saprospiraceae bacterium]|nr:DUF2911 domain-containing protein [Saprospiraceae bacterium]
MRKILVTLCVLALTGMAVQAQIKTPAPSPVAKYSTTVGLTDIEIEYSRPGVKDRTIFAADGLVPFGQMWRTGANASTKISFSDDVMVEGQKLAAGKYALYTVPGADKWDVIFYKDLSQWGVPQEYKQDQEALRVTVKPQKMNHLVETLLINIGNVRNNSAELELIWENTLVEVKLEMEVDKPVMSSIERTLAGPTSRDYYQAATYYHESGKDLNQALEYIQKANKMDPRFWQLRREALILADMKKYPEAIATAEKSKAMAQSEGNMDYVRMNEKSIAEWKGMVGGGSKSMAPGSKDEKPKAGNDKS